MNRRKFLKIAGSAGVIVAAGGIGLGGFAVTRTPEDALRPWKEAGSLYADPMRRALSYAILAPNPHNRQPWIVDVKGDREAVLTCDLERLLPHTDPFSRQIVIGLGCFLELFAMAAAETGHRAEISLFPEGEPGDDLDRRPIAHLLLVPDEGLKGDPLFAQTLKRHTNRNPYDVSRTIPNEAMTRLTAVENSWAPSGVRIATTNAVDQVATLRNLTKEAMRTEFHTPAAYRESVDLMRIGKAEIEANPDGISLGGTFLEGLNLFGVLTRDTVADPTSRAFKTGIEMSDAGATTAMGFVWIVNAGDSRIQQIDAGRAYMRVALRVTELGLAMQPMSQSLQEYEDMAPHYEEVHRLLTNAPGERVQMLARVGYADDTGPAPRWGVDTVIRGT